MFNKNEFSIGTRKVGLAYPPLVIAEIGINHGGSLDLAIEMVDNAIDHGAEIIKHQTHVVEDEMSQIARKVVPGHTKESIYEIMENASLSEEQEIKLQKHVQSRGSIFISTPFSRAAAERLKRMNIPAYKIGSGECNNYPLIKHIASFGKPIILSTGMNSIDSVRRSVEIIRSHNVPFALLHCTNVYPTPPELVRLGAMVELQEAFPDSVVGLSDHTITNMPCLGAVALGASILERHFTDRKDRVGPDIVCSMDGKEMKELIEGAAILQKARGGSKGAVEAEIPTINFAFASVVTIRPVAKGESFTSDNLWVKRPGTGAYKAEHFESLLGKKAARDIAEDIQISPTDVME
jgi:N-acetylneuraminate synthase